MKGWQYRPDVNDLPTGLGDHIGWVQQTRGGRFRASTARSYLRPVMKRPNLQVVTGALVHRVVFDGNRATGVEFSRGGTVEQANAAGGRVFLAGTVGHRTFCSCSTAWVILTRRRAGIAVQHSLRGVGKISGTAFWIRVCADVRASPP